MRKRFIAGMIVSFFLMVPVLSSCAGGDEGIGPDLLMKGIFRSPVTVSISSPAYTQISQFGRERTESLNRLLKHLGLRITLDTDVSETVLTVDREPAYSYVETEEESVQRTVYSFQPDIVYLNRTEYTTPSDPDFSGFLDDHFFILNRFLDDFYPLFEKTAEAFSEWGKPSAASLNFRGYGKGVRKLTIPLSDQYVTEHFPGAAAGLAETDEIREFLNGLVFVGPQKIILLYDPDDRLLRINYDGKVGLTEDSVRKVSIVWRCLRTADRIKDNITIKTPSVKGYDKYNITYERAVDLSDPQHHSISWDLQIDLRADQLKKKISYSSDLAVSDGILGGKVLFAEKQDGGEKKILIVPEMQKENEDEYSGTIEITNYSGKIITSSLRASVSVYPGEKPAVPEYGRLKTAGEPAREASENHSDPLQDQINSILIRRILELPEEDLAFLSTDIPEEIWDSLIQSIV